MTEALTEVAGWALRQPSIWRIDAVADIENIGSMRVMEKPGSSGRESFADGSSIRTPALIPVTA